MLRNVKKLDRMVSCSQMQLLFHIKRYSQWFHRFLLILSTRRENGSKRAFSPEPQPGSSEVPDNFPVSIQDVGLIDPFKMRREKLTSI